MIDVTAVTSATCYVLMGIGSSSSILPTVSHLDYMAVSVIVWQSLPFMCLEKYHVPCCGDG